jgi:divalent metal cation (Fe/Co/Zn/Cd) transporter
VHEGSRRAIIAAFLANLGIATAKFVAFLFTGAASMLAETVHSLADTGNQALLLLGASRAGRAASPEHPFGYGRERYCWSFVVALVLFSMGALFAIYEGVEKLLDPHALAAPQWAIGVLLAAIAVVLAIEIKSLLIGESASPEVQQRIRAAIEASESVRHLIHLRTLHLAPEKLLVGAKVEFATVLDVPGLARAIDEVEARVRGVVTEARVIYIEPDIHRDA